jgi:hypothetical protein
MFYCNNYWAQSPFKSPPEKTNPFTGVKGKTNRITILLFFTRRALALYSFG